jgi:O-antigen biosynthesis protein WbqV
MGQPVKIVDLARRLITLSGLEPGTDIAIEFTGMRPGEKLFEELLTAEQARVDTEHGKIFRSDQPVHPWTELAPRITQLEGLALAGDTEGIKALLHELIPDYLGANSAASLGEIPPANA